MIMEFSEAFQSGFEHGRCEGKNGANSLRSDLTGQAQ